MKVLALLVLLIPSISSAKQEIEFYYGSVVSHLFDQQELNYANKLSSNLISPPFYGFSYNTIDNTELKKYRVFLGEQSAGGAMYGGTYSWGRRLGLADFAFMVGGYLQDRQSFRDRLIIPFEVPLTQSVGFVPIAGVELGMRQQLTKDIDLRYNVAYSIVILQFTVSLSFRVGD